MWGGAKKCDPAQFGAKAEPWAAIIAKDKAMAEMCGILRCTPVSKFGFMPRYCTLLRFPRGKRMKFALPKVPIFSGQLTNSVRLPTNWAQFSKF